MQEVTDDHRKGNIKSWTKIKRLRDSQRFKKIKYVLKIWKKYYQGKLNKIQNEAENLHEVCLNDNLKIRQEVEKALRSIKLAKTCGADDLAKEMIK